jgi:hypothetical protein
MLPCLTAASTYDSAFPEPVEDIIISLIGKGCLRPRADLGHAGRPQLPRRQERSRRIYPGSMLTRQERSSDGRRTVARHDCPYKQ